MIHEIFGLELGGGPQYVESAVYFLAWDLILDSLELMVNLAAMSKVDDADARVNITM